MSYHPDTLQLIKDNYDPADVRTWPYYPIVMPLKEGRGPASDEECDQITWEVWDQVCTSYGRFDYLPDAINLALQLTKEVIQ